MLNFMDGHIANDILENRNKKVHWASMGHETHLLFILSKLNLYLLAKRLSFFG